MKHILIGPQTIRARRRARRLSVTALANRVGVSEMDVLRWEKGRASPTVEMCAILAEVLDLVGQPRPMTDRTTNGRREAADGEKERGGSVHPGPSGRRAKLSEEEVTEIKQSIEVGYGDKELGEIYGVSPATIWHIRKGLTWRGAQPR